jgi:glycosyltransferase involved in cell wall biosynthesis
MGNGRFVSVITPVFNGEPFLRETLESALAQTYRDFEIVTVDDGSTDRSREILTEYQARFPDRVRVFSQEHQGAAAARNRAIAEARGDWVALLDQDDLWDRNKLERQFATLEPQDDIVHAEARVIDGQGNLIRAMFSDGHNEEHATLPVVITLNPIYVLTVLARREAVLRVGGLDIRNRLGTDDYQLSLRLLAKGYRFHYLRETLASYRVHGRNTSSDHTQMMKGDIYALQRTYEEYPTAFDKAALAAYRNKMALLYFNLGWRSWDKNEYGEAANFFRQASRQRRSDWKPRLCAMASASRWRRQLRLVLRRVAGEMRAPAVKDGWYG